MFYVMEFCEGRILWGASLPEAGEGEAGNATRAAMYQEMNRVLAALHSVDLDEVGLVDYGKPGNYFERQLGRWTQQYEASKLQDIPAMDELIAWLQANKDLPKMEANTMDPEGLGQTKAGKICGIISVILLVVFAVIYLLVAVVFAGAVAAGGARLLAVADQESPSTS